MPDVHVAGIWPKHELEGIPALCTPQAKPDLEDRKCLVCGEKVAVETLRIT